MVHRIQNRNPGYSDFSNLETPQPFSYSGNMSAPFIEGATALKLENEITEQTTPEISSSNDIETTATSSSTLEKKSDEDLNSAVVAQTNETIENIQTEEPKDFSNGLENFGIEGIEEETPELFNSDSSETSEKEFTSFDTLDQSKEDDELEIPAFLRRQKN